MVTERVGLSIPGYDVPSEKENSKTIFLAFVPSFQQPKEKWMSLWRRKEAKDTKETNRVTGYILRDSIPNYDH